MHEKDTMNEMRTKLESGSWAIEMEEGARILQREKFKN